MEELSGTEQVLEQAKQERIRFMRLQFTDILGSIKNVEVPEPQFRRALEGQIVFDGSSILGFSREREYDMILLPDPATFSVFPWEDKRGKVARMICDVRLPDGSPFDGCPRTALKSTVKSAADLGYQLMAGSEIEFFLFQRSEDGKATSITHDVGGYFDLAPVDRGEEARRDMVGTLERMGLHVEGAHHEVAPGQHEIDLSPADAVEAADRISTCRFLIRKIALDHGLHATFMPKPLFGQNGSGLHLNQALYQGGENAFHDPKGAQALSDLGRHYIAGLLAHARGMVAITNPLVNSYKRLVPGYEAPTHVAWSETNRSPLVRLTSRRGEGTMCEFRLPDPSCNPYLALVAILSSGLEGIRRKMDPGPPVNKDIFGMSQREKGRLGIQNLPGNLSEAIRTFEKDKFLQGALGSHISNHIAEAKRREWEQYIEQVHPWEIERYLAYY
ncbi:MAG: type I glutamate--ammonia ligase [Acidobacteria bacterium]|nr:type I glutamate--ammonia ligase [Acidobacteriota bacterium]